MKDLGIILYDGPSLLDGEPIVCIATGIWEKSDNRKTGTMIQTWIIKKDMHPQIAVKTAHKKKINGLTVSNSYSVCGDCKHLHFKSCYVNLAHGPSQVFKAFHRNRYVSLNDDNIKEFKNRHIRLGAYGDPAAVPSEVWEKVCTGTKGHTGYTHQWLTCDKKLRYYVMASVDTKKEYFKAISKDWRTFRILLDGQEKMDWEFTCPASNEAGNKTNCEKCGNCSGRSCWSRYNPTINAHGGTGHMARGIALEKGLKKMKNKKKWRREFIEI